MSIRVRSPHPTSRPSLVAAAGGTLWVLAHAAGLLGAFADATFVLLGVFAIAAAVVGIRRHRPTLRWPWVAFSFAMVLFLFGGASRVALETLGDLTPSRSLVPDLITLPGYLVLGLGVYGLARARGRRERGETDAVLDAVVAALSVLALAWVFVINPVVSDAATPLYVRLLLACYVPMSVFVLVMVGRLAFSLARHRTFTDRALVIAFGGMLIGDIVYMMVDAHLADVPPTVIDVPYALGYVALVAGLLHPSMRSLSEPGRSTSAAPSRPRLAVVAVALAVPAIVITAWHDAGAGDRAALAGITLALTVTAVWRFFRALRDHARSESEMAHQAMHDTLTGLPNRTFTERHVARCIDDAVPGGSVAALLFLDLDNFKLVNDTFGHSIGDELLLEVTKRLRQNIGADDFVARIGGDEFVVVPGNVENVSQVLYLADTLRCCFHIPFMVGDSDIFVSVSVGVAVTSGADPNVGVETLIREADTAMYEAKAAGRDAVSLYDTSMRDRAAERLSIEHELRNAVSENQLHIEYQPVVQLGDERVEGVEALLRWNHPTLGNVSPARFIPVAEDSGLILEIGTWVLNNACRQVAEWRNTVPEAADLRVAVNVSARQLRDPDIVDIVARALSGSDLPGDALTIELTESLLMENPDASVEVLNALRTLGVRLSVDDFGTGYSSLAYLKRFPVHEVKIDRAFVEGLRSDDSSEESLVAAIIGMANTLGLTTVAEGVETGGQRDRLAALGCPRAQGYLFARPTRPEDLPALLGARESAEQFVRAVAAL